jgi:hypothetical protein
MAKLSAIGKMMKALDLAKKSRTGVEFTYFDVLELIGHINGFEEYVHDLKQDIIKWKQVAKNLSEELTEMREKYEPICWDDADETSYAQTLYKMMIERDAK